MRLEPCGYRAGQAPDDSIVIHAHHHTAGAKGDCRKEAPGRSRGLDQDPSSRVNGAGPPMRTGVTPGQDSDDTGYDLVMADNLPQPAVLVADRGYGSDNAREDIEIRNALPCVGITVPRTVP